MQHHYLIVGLVSTFVITTIKVSAAFSLVFAQPLIFQTVGRHPPPGKSRLHQRLGPMSSTNKKLRYREEHSASDVLSWCTL